MASTFWIKLQMTVEALRFDATIAEVKKTSERIQSIIGFCLEDEKAEKHWESIMKEVNRTHHELFLEERLK